MSSGAPSSPDARPPAGADPVPAAAEPPLSKVVERLDDDLDRQLLHERFSDFSDFERSVLQDNIVLCDQKAGVLLAFSGAMVIFCLDALAEPISGRRLGPWAGYAGSAALAAAALAFLVSCVFSLATVMPRLRRNAADDHIFWESSVFKLPAAEYVEAMRKLDPEVERDEKLRHLHTLAGICRAKFANFRQGIHFALIGFGAVVIAELLKAAA